MLENKLTFFTAYHPQTDGSPEKMIQTMEDIIRRLCAYGMEYKEHENIPMTGKSPSLVEKGLNPLLPVNHLKKNLLTIHPKAKYFHDMWKREFDTAAKCIAEAKEYNKQRYDKTHMEPGFKEGDQVLVYTPNFNNLKGVKKMRHTFVGHFTIIKLIGKNAVEVRLTEELSRKHPVFPVRLVKTYLQTGGDKFPSRNKTYTPQGKVEVEDFPGPVKEMIKEMKIRLNGKDQRQYLIRLKNQTADKAKWLEEDAIPDGILHLRILRASRRAEKSYK
ncbi:hypothetical protein O181_017560 [Austropuccinia psidii MF-1]|uniref:Tf2-1-like SH3-like domain-containing protein n=1 Tax=Austropuccinia psidii MF-1 TaxID=1389203 RepID=A0A9Q3C700_9BASI|nr:hypothetical protein [Austropuccinia psidii MF-1]